MNIYRQSASRKAGGAKIPDLEKERKRTPAQEAYRAMCAADEEADRKHNEEMDKKYPRLAEPDDEGFDLALDDPRRRFVAEAKNMTFFNPGPVTEEEKAEVDAMWEKMTGGNYSPKKKEAKKGRKTKDTKK